MSEGLDHAQRLQLDDGGVPLMMMVTRLLQANSADPTGELLELCRSVSESMLAVRNPPTKLLCVKTDVRKSAGLVASSCSWTTARLRTSESLMMQRC